MRSLFMGLFLVLGGCATELADHESASAEDGSSAIDEKADSYERIFASLHGEAIFRLPKVVVGTYGDWSYLKIKGDLAVALKTAMVDADEQCSGSECSRLGENILCVPPTVFDPTTCEIRFTRTRDGAQGQITSPRESFELYHSLEANRVYGTVRVEGTQLVFEGDAAQALENALRNDDTNNATGSTAAKTARFRVLDLAAGRLSNPSF